MRTLESLNQEVDIMLEQVDDMALLLLYSDIKIDSNKKDVIQNMYKRTYLNFKQRQRFLSISYENNAVDAMEKLFRMEFGL